MPKYNGFWIPLIRLFSRYRDHDGQIPDIAVPRRPRFICVPGGIRRRDYNLTKSELLTFLSATISLKGTKSSEYLVLGGTLGNRGKLTKQLVVLKELRGGGVKVKQLRSTLYRL